LSWFLCMVWDRDPISIFRMWKSCLKASFIEADCPFPIVFLVPLSKMSWQFWDLYSALPVYVSVFVLVPCCFDFYSFVTLNFNLDSYHPLLHTWKLSLEFCNCFLSNVTVVWFSSLV
jgi:hypothetical protein